jgi:hypothetical protein
MAAATAQKTIPAERPPELLELMEGSDSVELKLTVPISDRAQSSQALGIDPSGIDRLPQREKSRGRPAVAGLPAHVSMNS